MERIVNELRGISYIALEEMPAPKKQILTSRSFGEKLTNYDDLRAAVTHFAMRSAEKCRQQRLTTNAVIVFIQTSPFDTHNPQYSNSATIEFDLPTSDSRQFINAALQGLSRIYRKGYSYQRAGVMLPELWPEGVTQTSLFDSGERSVQSEQLMVTLDQINRKHGKRSIRYATEILSNRWNMRQQFKSLSIRQTLKSY